MAKSYAIEANNLHKSFKDNKVLEGVSFKVERGTILALLGPNGAGKTTTVRILTTLLEADSGTATVEGMDVKKQADDVRGVIGLTGQYAAVDEFLTGRENLHLMGDLYHLSKEDSRRRAEELLEQFDLVKAAGRPAKTYSGGMRRRLDLALSLIATPPIIFLDEPTTGLDPRSRMAMWSIIQKLVKDGATILLTTQYLDEADQLADKIIVIDGGKVIAEGTSTELKAEVGNDRVEFTFGSVAELKKAADILPDKVKQVDEAKRTVSIANDKDAYYVSELLDMLKAKNVKVSDMSIHKPTLDDVFLKLTGHQATTDEESTGKGKK